MSIRLLTCGTLLLCLVCNLSYAADSESSESEDFQRPSTRQMRESEIGIDDDFSNFQGGPFFMPPWPRGQHFFGYERPRHMFRDFKDEIQNSTDDGKTVCEGQTGEEVDGTVKLTFECSDDTSYSCYADNLSGSYAVDIPDEVLGKSCLISVETISVNDDESDVEVDGTETTEEVDLTEETTVEVDVE